MLTDCATSEILSVHLPVHQALQPLHSPFMGRVCTQEPMCFCVEDDSPEITTGGHGLDGEASQMVAWHGASWVPQTATCWLWRWDKETAEHCQDTHPTRHHHADWRVGSGETSVEWVCVRVEGRVCLIRGRLVQRVSVSETSCCLSRPSSGDSPQRQIV